MSAAFRPQSRNSAEFVYVLVEEPSAAEALRQLLPRLLGDVPHELIQHQDKGDLLARLPAVLRGYARWLPPTYRVVVLVDRDDDDCEELKAELEKVAASAGLKTRAAAGASPWSVATRIAIEELEAWFFGDWEAVRAAYPGVKPTVPTQAKYRHPDAIAGGTWEALERLLRDAGHFRSGLRKIEAARAIAAHMVPDRNSSPSFGALREVLRAL